VPVALQVRQVLQSVRAQQDRKVSLEAREQQALVVRRERLVVQERLVSQEPQEPLVPQVLLVPVDQQVKQVSLVQLESQGQREPLVLPDQPVHPGQQDHRDPQGLMGLQVL